MVEGARRQKERLTEASPTNTLVGTYNICTLGATLGSISTRPCTSFLWGEGPILCALVRMASSLCQTFQVGAARELRVCYA